MRRVAFDSGMCSAFKNAFCRLCVTRGLDPQTFRWSAVPHPLPPIRTHQASGRRIDTLRRSDTSGDQELNLAEFSKAVEVYAQRRRAARRP